MEININSINILKKIKKGATKGVAMGYLNPKRYFAKFNGKKVLLISIPKAGTHLLKKTLYLMPQIYPARFHIDWSDNWEKKEEILFTLSKGRFVNAHIPYSKEFMKFLEKLDFKTFLILRDPRDIVVSHFYYVTYKAPDHRLHDYFKKLKNNEERLKASITGVDDKYSKDNMGMENIGERIKNFIKWKNVPFNCTVYFENLIGKKGGGSKERQLKEVRKIADHLELNLSQKKLEEIANKVFWTKSSTFRKGIIGDWKNHFTEEHRLIFKEIAGNVLIEMGYENNYAW